MIKKTMAIICALMIPLTTLGSVLYVEEFENASPGTQADSYNSNIGTFSYTGSFTGYAEIAAKGPWDQYMLLVGPSSIGLGVLEFVPNNLNMKYVEFNIRVTQGIVNVSGIEIQGRTSTHTINLNTFNTWLSYSYEHSEPIERVLFYVGDHQAMNIDNLGISICQSCE